MLKSPLLWKMITLGGAMILLLIPLIDGTAHHRGTC